MNSCMHGIKVGIFLLENVIRFIDIHAYCDIFSNEPQKFEYIIWPIVHWPVVDSIYMKWVFHPFFSLGFLQHQMNWGLHGTVGCFSQLCTLFFWNLSMHLLLVLLLLPFLCSHNLQPYLCTFLFLLPNFVHSHKFWLIPLFNPSVFQFHPTDMIPNVVYCSNIISLSVFK